MKRAFDLFFSFLLLATFLIPIAIIVIAVKVSSKGPVFHWSTRVGRFSEPFEMAKFRTMIVGTPLHPTNELESPERYITKIGSALRKTSLDEIPQLYSVIKGDMSIVGPRPVLTSEIDLIELRKNKAVDQLRPGITGWAQINGRDKLSNVEKSKMDYEYLCRQSLWFDLLIIWRSVPQVVGRKDIFH